MEKVFCHLLLRVVGVQQDLALHAHRGVVGAENDLGDGAVVLLAAGIWRQDSGNSAPKWRQNRAKAASKWLQNGVKLAFKLGSKWPQNGVKLASSWRQAGVKMGRKWRFVLTLSLMSCRVSIE